MYTECIKDALRMHEKYVHIEHKGVCLMSIRQGMPLLARHEGEWIGEYVLVDGRGEVKDRHKSHLKCEFPSDGSHDYFQTNTYTWDDGKQETFSFPATYRDGRIWFDTERIEGSAWEIDAHTIVLTWERKDIKGAKLYEMIQLSEDGQHRTRTWHWLSPEGEVQFRTLIKETRKS